MSFSTCHPFRSVIKVAGADRFSFLQGLVSNDVTKLGNAEAIYAALLTPQGKFLHDLFVVAEGDDILIDCEASRREDLLRRLLGYTLRSKVTCEDLSATHDVALFSEEPANQGIIFRDPRLANLGFRSIVLKEAMAKPTAPDDFFAYDMMRISLGVADGSRDLEVEKSTLAEGNFDFLHGIDWKKGCYVGQELTARMHYRGLTKKRIFPIRVEGALISPGDVFGEVAAIRSVLGAQALAVLRVDVVMDSLDREAPLIWGDVKMWPTVPAWMKFDVKPSQS